MPHRTLSIEEAAAYLHLTVQDVDRLLRETDIPHATRGDRMVFPRGELDAWASQRILGLAPKRLDTYHQQSSRGTRKLFPEKALVPQLLTPEYIQLELSSKTRASVLRDMVALAEQTGRLYDPRELLASVEERESLCSTALPGGLALLHARHMEAYRFEGSFLVLGRTVQSVPFGAPDGRPTRLFFLLCCEDERIHLHSLARLCTIAMKTNIIAELMEAADSASAFEALRAAELSVLPPPETFQ